MFRYKIDVLEELKKKGFTTYKIQKEKLIGSQSINYIRNGKIVGINTLDTLCGLLNMDIGDIIEHVKDNSL